MCIVLSGMHTAEQQKTTRLLKQLGMPADYIVRGNDTHGWDVRATHVVMPVLKRVTKSLGAMAAGCWLVSSAFVEESAKRRAFQHPVRGGGISMHCVWLCVVAFYSWNAMHTTCRILHVQIKYYHHTSSPMSSPLSTLHVDTTCHHPRLHMS